jgi:hypothetical protein
VLELARRHATVAIKYVANEEVRATVSQIGAAQALAIKADVPRLDEVRAMLSEIAASSPTWENAGGVRRQSMQLGRGRYERRDAVDLCPCLSQWLRGT